MLPCRPDMLRMLEAARLTGATDIRRDAAAMAISSCSTAAINAPDHATSVPDSVNQTKASTSDANHNVRL